MPPRHSLTTTGLFRVSGILLIAAITGGFTAARRPYSQICRLPPVTQRLPEVAEDRPTIPPVNHDALIPSAELNPRVTAELDTGRHPLVAQIAAGGQQPAVASQDSYHARTPPIAESPPLAHPPPITGIGSCLVPYSPWDFSTPTTPAYNWMMPEDANLVFRQKAFVPTQRPWLELGRPFYEVGQFPPASTIFGPTNLTTPHFLIAGDLRSAIASSANPDPRITQFATRLNLDVDWKWTATERVHALFTPLNNNADFTRFEIIQGHGQFIDHFNANPTTAFFEGDLGALVGGWRGTAPPFDLPFTAGLVPLLFQNGVWMEDAILGIAANLPARNSPALGWPNYEVTVFAGFDQLTSGAFPGDNQAANVYGVATFIEAYEGYIEAGYAFLDDGTAVGRSYHNLTASFTRRYWNTISNSVRAIVNFGQDTAQPLTADGVLVLLENSLITTQPSTVVPYFNVFGGFGQPQSVARGAAAGGVLRNTGINFESDNLTGYPTLDATGHNTCGGALGLEWLNHDFTKQLVVEGAFVHPFDDLGQRQAVGSQVGVGTRYQTALTNNLLLRIDGMVGFLENAADISGLRAELRHKF